MASTFTTGFGIEKIGSGEQSGTWGTTTNHNFDIIDRIASYKAVAITTNADTATLTVREASPGSGTENLQDGMYRVIKFTGALDSDCTVTIAPNTAPAWFIIENATTDSGSSGPYSLILSQGSGANVTVQNGKNAIIYCDGAGSGAAVVDALADLQIGTLEVTGAAAIDGAATLASTLAVTGAVTGSSTIQGTTITATTAFVPDASDGAALGTTSLEFSDLYLADGAVIGFGDEQDVTLTHVADTGLLLSSTDQLQFGDSGTYIHQSADGVLDLVSDTEIEINATTIDINGAVDVSGAYTGGGNATITGTLTATTGVGTPSARIHALQGADTIIKSETVDADSIAQFVVKNDAREYALQVRGNSSDSFVIRDNTGSGDRITLDTSGNTTFAGDIKYSGSTFNLNSTTSDGSDNGRAFITGGGSADAARGSFVGVYGNENSSSNGQLLLAAGSGSAGDIVFQTGGTERMRLAGTGLTVGVDDTGYDVKFFGDTASRYWLWDTSADGVVQRGTLTVGVDDTGHDVKFFGATSGKYMLWDESADTLLVAGNIGIGAVPSYANLQITEGAGTLPSETESGATLLQLQNNSSTSDNVRLSLIAGTAGQSNIAFGDSGDENVGSIYYNHSSNLMGLRTSGTGVDLTISSGGNIAFPTDGVVLSFGADSEVTLTHVADTGLRIEDSDKMLFGTGADLEIFHDGTNSKIVNNATSDFVIDAAGDIKLDADGGDIIFLDGGTAIATFANNANNLRIVSNVSDADIILRGVDGVAAINALTLDMSDAGTAKFNHDIKLENDGAILYFGADNDVSATHVADVGLNFASTRSGADSIFRFSNSANASASDVRVIIQNGGTSGGDPLINLDGQATNASWSVGVDTSETKFVIADADKGGFDGSDEVFTIATGGGLTLTPEAGGHAVFNEGSVDADFRVESDGNANMLFVDGGNNKVSIGTNTSDGTLHVHTATAGSVAAASSTDDLIVENSTHGGINILIPDASYGSLAFGSPSDNHGFLVDWSYDAGVGRIHTSKVGAKLELKADNSVTQVTFDGAAGSQFAEFANDIGLKSDSSKIYFGADNDITLTHTADTGLTLSAGSSGATANSAANTFVVEDNANAGISILSPDANSANLYLGSASDNNLVYLEAKDDAGTFKMGTTKSGMAVYIASGNNTTALTLDSSQNATFAGSLSKGSGSFKIDHPLPAKKDTHHLVHSFVEGPQADLIYRGRATLSGGSATVNIDAAAGMTSGTFEALCRDVQCFTTNETGWTAVRGSVSGATLTIEAQDSDCTDTISWMVVGERKDQHIIDTDWTDDNGKVIVEPEKSEEEKKGF